MAGHVVSNVVFHQFCHEAVDGAASGGEALQNIGAGIVGVKGAQSAFELADDLLGAVDKVQFFARGVRHLPCIPYRGMVSRR